MFKSFGYTCCFIDNYTTTCTWINFCSAPCSRDSSALLSSF